jgi:hypothetical protein
MRVATRCAAVAVVLGVTIAAAAAGAASPANVRRCGYAHSRYWGRVAVYPWRMSCRAARETLTQSEFKHDSIFNFTADGAYTFDGGAAVKIAGRWWVCGGRMGLVLLRLSVPACDGAWRWWRHDLQGSVHEGVRRRGMRTARRCVGALLRPSSRHAPTDSYS